MPTKESNEFQWRETYFVCFDAAKRPPVDEVQRVLKGLRGHFKLKNLQADDEGAFESVTLFSAEDHAALEISYLAGDDVRQQAETWSQELPPAEDLDADKLARLAHCDARFDLMHFEQIVDDEDDDDEMDDMLDPSALLIVFEALVELTDGVGVDPQSGTLL